MELRHKLASFTSRMKCALFFFFLSLSSPLASTCRCYDGIGIDPIEKSIKLRHLSSWVDSLSTEDDISTEYSSVYMSPQVGLKEANKILRLPGQPKVEFDHYSGYVPLILIQEKHFFTISPRLLILLPSLWRYG